MDFLADIKVSKTAEVAKLRDKQAENSFQRLLAGQRKEPVLIAEVKMRSPSEKQLFSGDPVALARSYRAAGADALSVVTDGPFFGGSLELLGRVRNEVGLPILRKDFILDESQIVQTLQYHADAILLIAGLVSPKKLASLISFSHQVGLLPVVEISKAEEIAIVVNAGAKAIGVNARDLHSFKVNPAAALNVVKSLPPSVTALSFSGMKTREDIIKASRAGAKGVLVGTALLKADNIEAKIKELKG